MTSKANLIPGAEAIAAKGWLNAHRYLILRRLSQAFFLALFLIGPWFGLWWVKGNLAGSRTFDVLPLTDPFIMLQSIVAGHVPALTAILGALCVGAVYALIGGRMYCSWVCPINPVTDAAHWLHKRLNLPKGWQPKRHTKLFMVGMVFLTSALSGTIAWEFVNPITMVHRALVFGGGFAAAFVIGVFVFDLVVARRGWCGHLCPVGAFYGLLGSKSLLRVSAINRAACDDCMDCFAVCPEMHVITPALRGSSARSPIIFERDCTNCGRCIDVCSVDVFEFTHRFDTRPSLGRVRSPSKSAPKATPAT
ncbi:MAG: quinol dehydrogenase ferredoxin subunit NapH [Maritimibacter sp.]